MKRRKALSTLSWISGGSLLLPQLTLSGCLPELKSYRFFTPEQVELLDQIGETILPETPDSPGAKAVLIGEFIDLYIADCLKTRDQTIVSEGLVAFEESCQARFGRSFLKLEANQQEAFLVDLDEKAQQYQERLKAGDPSHYFAQLKGMVLLGYFTSQDGMSRALRYRPIPGGYEGDIPYRSGDKAWASY